MENTDRKTKKITARDVAQAAGVSVATVSYVMNDRPDQKINPETRKKILQIANLMNYVPSHAAKSLATGRNNSIGISYSPTGIPTRDSSVLLFSLMLTERLNRMKYDVTFIPARKTDEGLPINRNVDAIIAIDLDHTDFRSLADNYLVPVICVDMLVNDELFYQIYDDIPFLVQKSLMELGSPKRCYFIYDSFNNANYEQFVLKLPDGVFPLRQRELTPSMLSSLKNEKVIVLGGFLALKLLGDIRSDDICAIISEREKGLLPASVSIMLDNSDKKANLTMNIVMNALKRNFEVKHDHKIQ